MALVEREAHFATLAQCLDDARSGSGTLVLVGGEAGAGKSALVSAYLHDAGSGVDEPVVAGWCDAVATPKPLGAVVERT